MTWLRSSRRAKNDRIRSTSPDAVGVSHTITAACSSEWMAWSMAGGLRYTPAPSGTGAWGPDAGGVDGYVDSGGDHRVAMALAVAGLSADGGVEIDDDGCVGISFASFFSLLEGICGA